MAENSTYNSEFKFEHSYESPIYKQDAPVQNSHQ